MSGKATKKDVRTSDRKKEREIFNAILRNESSLRGLVIHSNNQGGTGKTTLLKMFESDCQTLVSPRPSVPFYFTTKPHPLKWQLLLDSTVERLGSHNFKTYTQLRDAYTSIGKNTVKDQPNVTYITNINSIQGPVHTGSGDLKTTYDPSPQIETLIGDSSTKLPTSQEDTVKYLTQVFLQDLKNLAESLQVVWLVDAVEKLDELNQAWLIDLFQQIVDGNVTNLIVVAAGRELLCCEPYWTDKIEELYLGNFDENVILEIVSKIWPTAPSETLRAITQLLMKLSGGKPMELILHIESLNPYE